MATDIVGSLFGITPEAYQQQQSALADAQALEYAKLTPFQQAQFGIGRGAYGLAGALGTALGAQDPMLQMVSARNAIAKQLDYTNPESIKAGVQQLSQAGDTTGAMQLAQILRQVENDIALRQQRMAASAASLAQATRERTQAIPGDILKAQEIGRITTALQTPDLDEYTRASLEAQLASLKPEKEKPGATQLQIATEISNTQDRIDALTRLPASPDRDAALNRASSYLDALQRQLPQPKEVKAVVKEIGVAKDTGQPVLLDAEGLFVYKDIDGKQTRVPFSGAIESKTPKTEVKNVMPGTEKLADIPAFRASVQRTIEPQLQIIGNTRQAEAAIDDSLRTGNFASFRAAQTQFAKAIAGAGDLSQRELRAAGADPSMLGGFQDYVSTLFTSTPSTDTQTKIKAAIRVLQNIARQRASAEVEQQRKIALRSPGYNPEAVTEALTFPELQDGATVTTGGSLADQARAELERRKQAR